MFHDAWELATIAQSRQQDLYRSSSQFHVASSSPGLMARARRQAGLALIAAGERLADRPSRRSAPAQSPLLTAGTVHGGHAN